MKKFLLVLFVLSCFVSQGQVRVLGYIIPNGSTDTYPTHLDINGAGGLMSFTTIAERDAIPTLRRRSGMLAYVSDSVKTYQLSNDLTTWTAFQTGSNGEEIDPVFLSSIAHSITQLNIDFWNRISLLPFYSTTDSMLSKIDSAITNREYTFNTDHFLLDGRLVSLRYPTFIDSLFLNSVAYNINQQDIDNWNSSVDLSGYLTAVQTRLEIMDSLAKHKYYFDGTTIQGTGTELDPFTVVPFGDTGYVQNLNIYTRPQTDSAIAANFHEYSAGYGLILENGEFRIDSSFFGEPLFIASVAYNISQQDIDRWNDYVSSSNYYTKIQTDSIFASQTDTSHLYVDGETIQGNGTIADPLRAVGDTDFVNQNVYTKIQIDSIVAANFFRYGAGYGILLNDTTHDFSVDTSLIGTGDWSSDTAVQDMAGINDTTIRVYKKTGYYDINFGSGGTTGNQATYSIYGNPTAIPAAPIYYTNPFLDSVRRNAGSLTVEGRVNGTWKTLFTDSTGGGGSSGWALTGNSISPGTNFIGTTSNNSLRIRTNNLERMVVDSTGKVGIGMQPNIGYHLDVAGEARFNSGAAVSTVSIRSFGNRIGSSTLYGIGFHSTSAASIGVTGTDGDVHIKSGGTQIKMYPDYAASVPSVIFSTQVGIQSQLGGGAFGTSGAIIKQVNVVPTYNYTSGAVGNTMYGYYYKPTLTSIVGTRNVAIETVTGNTLLGTTSGSVAIGAPDAVNNELIGSSTILRINSTAKGVLLPRMTTTQRDAISGELLSISITGFGSGYTNGTQSLTFSGGGGSGAEAYVNISGGIVVDVHLRNSGSGYTSTPTISLTAGGGSGATFSSTVGIPEGLEIYNITTHAKEYYNGTVWKTITTN